MRTTGIEVLKGNSLKAKSGSKELLTQLQALGMISRSYSKVLQAGKAKSFLLYCPEM